MSQEKVLEILCGYANAQKAAALGLKHQILELVGADKESAAVKEETFSILKWETKEGAKIGPYEVAYEANNLADKWVHAYNILRQNNSTINARYHGEGYVYGYWLYGEGKIYRQKLKPKA
jgi:hypothetical protein